MSFWEKAKCFTGFHEWSTWSYSSTTKCDQTRYCGRSECNKRETGVSHSWGAWVDIDIKNCKQQRKCSRCGEVGTAFNHQWGVWDYASPTSCVQVRFCRSCKNGEETKMPEETDHNWGKIELYDCTSGVTKCLRCKEKRVVREDFHKWTQWFKEHKYDTHETRRCRTCSKTERQY